MRALVLSGGGVKGAFQLGVLHRWLSEGRKYDIYCGVSVGAINAAYLAQFMKSESAEAFKGLRDLWMSIDDSDVKKGWCLGKLAALWKTSLYDSSPLRSLVQSQIDPVRLSMCGQKLRIISVSLDTGKAHCANEWDDKIHDRILASAAFPAMLTPIRIQGELFVDGGVRNVTPLGAAIEAGATEVDVIMCDNPDVVPHFDSRGKSTLRIATRTLELMVNQIQLADLRVCGFKNKLADLAHTYRKVRVNLVKPKTELVEDSLLFDPNIIRALYLEGLHAIEEELK
jgi:NTE family protein